MPAWEYLVQGCVSTVPRSRVLNLALQRRRIAQHGRQPVFRERLPHRKRRLNAQDGAGILVDVEADDVQKDFSFPNLGG